MEDDIERELHFPPLVGEQAMEEGETEVDANNIEKSQISRPESSLQKELFDSIQAVKEKLRARLPVKLTIIKVEVNGLPKVHRFVRNKPWVKAQYGISYSWSADYIESEIGDHALWNDVDWSFTIERNQRDRQDLVVAICSKDMIIGRYILGRDEISDLAESAIANHLRKQDDGDEDLAEDYIAIEGEIINALGSAGKIHILCSRKVQGGFLPEINEASVAGNLSSSVLLDSPSRSPRPGSPSFENYMPLFSYHEVTVRLLAVAVMDLQSVHYFQSNSPTVCIDVGSYVNITETKVNAGMAARWTDLYWRFTVSRDHGMIVTVVSNSVLIGKCVFATEELISVAPNTKGTISLIKLLSNGRELTGKIKISLIINHPEDMFAPAASLGADVRESIYPKERLDVDRLVPSDIIRPQNSIEFGGSVDQGSEEHKGDLRSAPQSRVLNEGDLDGTFIVPQSRPHSPQSSAVLDSLPVKMRIKGVPFTIVVQEVTVLDVKWPSSMTSWMPVGHKSLRLHLGCGLHAFSTDDMRTNGRFAHWLDMVWKVPVVADTNCLRITLWSHSANLGEASLPVKDLLGMPTTKTGRTEIFAKIHNEANEIAGRVRIACHYERGNTVQSDKDVHRVNGALTTLKAYNSAPTKTLANKSPAMTQSTPAVGISPVLSGNCVASPDGSKALTSDEPFVPSFPLLIHVKSIALVDVMVGQASSILFRPTLFVQMVCDRKQAVTDEVRPLGGAAKFEKMEWKMYVRQDSYLAVVVKTKQGATVGKAEISTEKLIDQPLLSGGTAQVT
ncbi:hypothetical protein EON65_08960 [archaeon]|nr:MAG: hypothetical protein EON65_08960 [archaeon]